VNRSGSLSIRSAQLLHSQFHVDATALFGRHNSVEPWPPWRRGGDVAAAPLLSPFVGSMFAHM